MPNKDLVGIHKSGVVVDEVVVGSAWYEMLVQLY